MSVDDIKLAKEMFGSDVASSKEKMAQQINAPVVREILSTQVEVDLFINTLLINFWWFLEIMFRDIQIKRMILFTLKLLQKIPMRRSWIQNQMQESKYRHWLKFAFSNEYAAEAEYKSLTTKQHIQSAFHNLPFKAIPPICIKHLANESAEKLQSF